MLQFITATPLRAQTKCPHPSVASDYNLPGWLTTDLVARRLCKRRHCIQNTVLYNRLTLCDAVAALLM